MENHGKFMQNQLKYKLTGFIFISLITSLACNALIPTPASSDSSGPSLEVNPPTKKVETYPPSTAVEGWVTFTGNDDLYTIDIPKNWLTDYWGGEEYVYSVENFQSADSNSYLEVFVSDDGRPFKEIAETYIYALSVLKNGYSEDFEVESRIVQENGREILIWKSKIVRFESNRVASIYEVKNKTTFIMLNIYGYTPEKQSSDETKKIIGNFSVQFDQPLETPSAFEYSTVAEALADMEKKEGANVQVSEGWTLITEADGAIWWAFAPADSPAYPAVVKRTFYLDENGRFITQNGRFVSTEILCESDEAACDQLKKDFEELNNQMRLEIEKERFEEQGINP
jgi:hypothetical protein